MKIHLIQKAFPKKIIVKMRQAIEKHKMISPGSKILIGVSGGKDSIAMGLGLELLKITMKVPFETVWIHLDYGAGGDPTLLKHWLRQYGIELKVEQTDIWESVENRDGGSSCYLCAKLRRGALGRLMSTYDCDRIALGHHLDDAMSTFWMNIKYNARIRTFKPYSRDKQTGRITIRPLIYCEEADIIRLNERMTFPKPTWKCPYEGDTERSKISRFHMEIKSQMPDLDQQLAKAFGFISDEDAWR